MAPLGEGRFCHHQAALLPRAPGGPPGQPAAALTSFTPSYERRCGIRKVLKSHGPAFDEERIFPSRQPLHVETIDDGQMELHVMSNHNVTREVRGV